MALGAGTRLGPYEIIAPLGAGGMGEVYRARDSRLERDVAIKILPARLSGDPAALARFEREAKSVAALSHPSILAIFDVGTADGVSYAVMELLTGETLRARLADGPLPVRKALDYAIQIAHGLGAAHQKGIVHRDLKPENLFVTNEGRVTILDFGLARQSGLADTADANAATVAGSTEPGTVLGTVGYMSPEQVRGFSADARSDIFSFGAVLYEMLSGQRAFKGESAAETMTAILTKDPPELAEANPSLPPALERIVHHCLEKLPEQRFQSSYDVAFDLEALSTSSGKTRALVPRGTITGKRAASAIALLAAGIALGMLVDRVRTTRSAEAPTYRRLTFDRGDIGQARFAPDGNTVVYSAAWRGEPTELFTTRLDSRESRPLGLGSATLLAVSSTSELATGHECRGCRRCCRASLFPEGHLARSVDAVTWADWLPDGSDLAVVRVLENSQRVEFPIGKVLYETGGTSPICVSRHAETGLPSLIIPSEALTPVLSWLSIAAAPEGRCRNGGATSSASPGHPDGREVWFTAGMAGDFKSLRAVTLDGKERLIARMLGEIDLEDISRDRRVLLSRVNWGNELNALPPGASTERDLTWLGLSCRWRTSRRTEDGCCLPSCWREPPRPASRTCDRPMVLRPSVWVRVRRLHSRPTGSGRCVGSPHQSASSSSRQGRANERHCRDPS